MRCNAVRSFPILLGIILVKAEVDGYYLTIAIHVESETKTRI